MDYNYIKLEILKMLLGNSGGDYVTEHVIRDTQKIYDDLFNASDSSKFLGEGTVIPY